MVSSINLGGLVQVGGTTTNGTTTGGTTIANGLSSGLNTQALITAATNALAKPATNDQAIITSNNNIITALGQLQNQLSTLMNASSSLAGVVDASGNQSSNVFNSRQGFITSNSTIAGSTYLGVTANNNAAIANYNVTVGSLAQALIQRTNSFTSQTASVTGAPGSSNANMFSAGTFQITGGQAVNAVSIAAGDVMTSASITSSGSVGSAVLDSAFGTGGVGSITVTGSGDTALVGGLSNAQVSASQSGGAGTAVTLTFSINGSTYTSNAITANSGGSSNQIAAGTVITLTNSTKGTSFQVRVAGATTISSNSDLSTFAANVQGDLSSVTFAQSHSISAFSQTAASATTTLNGLTSANVKLNSSEYNPGTGGMGNISNFVVTAQSAPGANDASIQVTINGETYSATGLNGTQNSNITLTSATSGSTLSLNIAASGVSLNLSTATAAKTVQKDLNDAFGTGVDITLNQGDNLQTIAGKINSNSSKSGLSASVLQIANNSFELTLQATQTGVANAYIINDAVNSTMSQIPLTLSQGASNASFTVNNISLTRPTNQITDAIPGVTFNLYQPTPTAVPATVLQVQVTNNGTAIQSAITNFITSYNNLKTFAAQQQQRTSSGAFASTAYLGNDDVLTNTLTTVQTELNKIVSGLSPGALASLASIGITFTNQPATTGTDATPEVDNILTVDSSKLTSAIATNPQAVQGIFDQVFSSSNNSKLQVFTTTNKLSVNNFSVNINASAPTGQKVVFTYQDSSGATKTAYGGFSQNAQGGIITGQDGTPFAGMTLLYVGSGNDNITGVNLTQGIADRIFNILSNTVSQNGSLTAEVNSLTKQNTSLNSQITTINQQVANQRTLLINKYAALDAAISQANSLLQFLNVQAGVLTGGNVSG